MNLLRYALLPVRAPMLLLLFGVSTYLGSRWSHTLDPQIFGSGLYRNLLLSVECLQALLVVVVCTIPDVLMHQLSTMMAYSRVVSLVGSLLLVIAGGLYLLHLSVFSSVLILACSVLLVRLDLVRAEMVPPRWITIILLSLVVMLGVFLGWWLALNRHL
ncbi:MAG: hypothetical protein ACK5QQ_04230 [Cyanobacteriota bacterium]|jgi:hypothetical protein|nr:hypothetical protein [Cyanobium sp. 49614_E6]